MPGYFKDDTVLRVCVEDIEATVGKARLRGKDDDWWRKVSDAMWNMIEVSIAVDITDDYFRSSQQGGDEQTA